MYIVPGAIKHGAPRDVVRSEETQTFGALEQVPGLRYGACLVMPGTYCGIRDIRSQLASAECVSRSNQRENALVV
jgi:2-keto-3-deoxy-galactonokinase